MPCLYKLANVPEPHGIKCLSFQKFLELLVIVHRAGNAIELNVHIRPQDKAYCFAGTPPECWSRVAQITDEAALDELASHLVPAGHWKPVHLHAPSESLPDVQALKAPLWGGARNVELLEALTKSETAMLEPYLHVAGAGNAQATTAPGAAL